MLLAQGKIIYFNDQAKAVDYFSSIGYECPELSNPSDFFMTIMSIESIEAEDADVQYKKRIEHFDNEYKKSDLKNDASLDAGLKPLESKA